MKQVLAIRHMYSASLFTLEEAFRSRGFDITYVEGYTADLKHIDPLTPDVMVVLGGAMGVYQADLFPYLHDEIALIQKRVAADRPLLGICLGAQLMAKALGKNVYKGQNGSEIGYMDIDLTTAGEKSPLRHFDKKLTKILQWHGDTFDLPDSATLLATSPKYTNQAYQVGKNAFAVQFHPEVNHAGFENTLVEACSHIDVLALRTQSAQCTAKMERQMCACLDDLLRLWNLS